MLFYIGAIIIHEYCHFGDNKDGHPEENIEEGELFEKEAYGQIVDSVDTAIEMIEKYAEKNNIKFNEINDDELP